MTNNSFKNIRFFSYVAILFCAIWAVFMVVHFIQIFGGNKMIDWSQHSNFKIGFVGVYIVSCFATIWMCVKFVINTLKGRRDNTVFPKSNAKLLYWLALSVFIYLLCSANELILYNKELTLRFMHINVVVPFLLLFFAFMYKVAADSVEENNLTV